MFCRTKLPLTATLLKGAILLDLSIICCMPQLEVKSDRYWGAISKKLSRVLFSAFQIHFLQFPWVIGISTSGLGSNQCRRFVTFSACKEPSTVATQTIKISSNMQDPSFVSFILERLGIKT